MNYFNICAVSILSFITISVNGSQAKKVSSTPFISLQKKEMRRTHSYSTNSLYSDSKKESRNAILTKTKDFYILYEEVNTQLTQLCLLSYSLKTMMFFKKVSENLKKLGDERNELLQSHIVVPCLNKYENKKKEIGKKLYLIHYHELSKHILRVNLVFKNESLVEKYFNERQTVQNLLRNEYTCDNNVTFLELEQEALRSFKTDTKEEFENEFLSAYMQSKKISFPIQFIHEEILTCTKFMLTVDALERLQRCLNSFEITTNSLEAFIAVKTKINAHLLLFRYFSLYQKSLHNKETILKEIRSQLRINYGITKKKLIALWKIQKQESIHLDQFSSNFCLYLDTILLNKK